MCKVLLYVLDKNGLIFILTYEVDTIIILKLQKTKLRFCEVM